MADAADAGGHLEQVLFQLLDYQSKQGADQVDTMLMLGLLNLLGMVSVMNKQTPAPPAAQAGSGVPGPALNPMMSSLLNMLAKGAPGGGAGSGTPPFNPAMLMNLMSMMSGMGQGSGQGSGQGPDMAGMMNLLSSMMNSQGQSRRSPPADGGLREPAPAVRRTQPEPSGRVREIKTAAVPGAAGGGAGEAQRHPGAGQVLKWGHNLERGKRA
ncbi:hypothetical protein [Desulfotomaculum copahuensis]|uniref:Uncharacterized protein n=1 Tax=Desulfotomaculum copahuensis TaxID=1838280 RepID=A0A1B7LFL1_9FIRM|nr:hypothetical protein [Desulfotomaculum copahuensis]OAT82950.1 hypothetical protein A6M21_08305 [Desulfotomaculum copahuensis]